MTCFDNQTLARSWYIEETLIGLSSSQHACAYPLTDDWRITICLSKTSMVCMIPSQQPQIMWNIPYLIWWTSVKTFSNPFHVPSTALGMTLPLTITERIGPFLLLTTGISLCVKMDSTRANFGGRNVLGFGGVQQPGIPGTKTSLSSASVSPCLIAGTSRRA